MLRAAAMYGLVEWLGGDRFAVRVFPDADRLEWDDSFYARAELLRGKVARAPTEQARSHGYRDRTVEVVEYKTKSYFVAYVGGGTGAEGVNRFVYRAWDPEKHSGVVLRARGKNIPIATEVGRRLSQGASEVFEYTQTGTEIYRDANGLCTDTFLEVRLRGQKAGT